MRTYEKHGFTFRTGRAVATGTGYRYNAAPHTPRSIPEIAISESPTVIDLFCGAGGLSLGFQRAGFAVVAAYDHWLPAVNTYRANFDDHVHHVEIAEDLELPNASVVVGGPPCQGFSSAGMRRSHDERNTMIGVFSGLIARARPLAFMFENVEGFLTGSRGQFVLDLLNPLVEAGYRIHLRKINAANYGVPQHRKRVVAIGGLGWDPTFPEPTHSAYGAPGAHLATTRRPKSPTIGDALKGLPDPALADESNDALDHEFCPLRPDELARAHRLEQGQSMRDLPEELWHHSYRRRAFRRVQDGTPTERRGGAPAGVRRLRLDQPSKAITGGAMNELLHPLENRPLTIRECARLQTFPDDFRFVGSRRDRVQLIGNAVPPRLAEIFAQRLASDMLSASPTHSRGRLLSFVPTMSSGASPVLMEVVQRVESAFAPDDSRVDALPLWR